MRSHAPDGARPPRRGRPSAATAWGRRVEVDDDNDDYDDDDEVVVSNVEVALRCRHTKQSFLFGFVDHDGAHAVAAAIAPRIGCSTGGEELGGAAP